MNNEFIKSGIRQTNFPQLIKIFRKVVWLFIQVLNIILCGNIFVKWVFSESNWTKTLVSHSYLRRIHFFQSSYWYLYIVQFLIFFSVNKRASFTTWYLSEIWYWDPTCLILRSAPLLSVLLQSSGACSRLEPGLGLGQLFLEGGSYPGSNIIENLKETESKFWNNAIQLL